jgi:hypothetical protein
MDANFGKARSHRQKAVDLRAIAVLTQNYNSRQMLHRVADDYVSMAGALYMIGRAPDTLPEPSLAMLARLRLS